MPELNVITKIGEELTAEEIRIIEINWRKEFDELQFNILNKDNIREYYSKDIFFFVKNQSNHILSMGKVSHIHNVIFMDQDYSILGINGIVSVIKRKGYGKRLMLAIREYAVAHGLTAIGFTDKKDFLLKSGFGIIENGAQLFVEQIPSDIKKEHIFYYNGNDNFINLILANTTQRIYLPQSKW